MRLNHQFCTTLQGLNLEELLGKYACREYVYHQLEEYGASNYSLLVPNHLKVDHYRDGYDFIAYEGSQCQDYMLAPLVVTIRNRRLDLASFHTKSDQRKFLKQLVKRELNQVGIDELVETVIDGHPALVIRESVKQLGVVTRAFLISHQRLLQITVSFTGNFTNTLEVTETIIKSFKVHSTPSPQNATLTTMESTYGKFELEVSRPFHADVQYVITLSPTGHFFMH